MAERLRAKAKTIGQGLRDNKGRVILVTIFIALALIALNMDYKYPDGTQWVLCDCAWGEWLANALISVGPELAGIVIGVVTIDYLNERRQDKQLREQLILQMGSKNNDVTDTAIRALRARGWLEDGSLKGAFLPAPNLEEAILKDANLEGAYLIAANLEGALLSGSNLKGADLREANLEGAILIVTDLSGADLGGASLKWAYLIGANLEGANLFRANLESVKLGEANLEGATMSDGIKLKGPNYPDGPTYEEWLAMQESQVDEATLQEIAGALEAEGSSEE